LKILVSFKPSKLTVQDAPYVADKGAINYTTCTQPVAPPAPATDKPSKLQKVGKFLGKLIPSFPKQNF